MKDHTLTELGREVAAPTVRFAQHNSPVSTPNEARKGCGVALTWSYHHSCSNTHSAPAGVTRTPQAVTITRLYGLL
ncbi:hypothetical protein EVAR_39348_1 [Eumeta japonica]|uniref:Uncharacterized protein n=1 Tax=Eumeta variegata TaxID=151549 RepID=A0A4C1WPM6_EUMVA|nr:hypothetical protein EVAR_39348_1 [Eumeta japonica]